MKSIYDYSYNEICLVPSPLKEKLLEEFDNLMYGIPLKIYSDSKKLGYMIMENELLEDENVSDYVFPGEKVIYYSNIHLVKAAKEFLCAVSGERFKKGNECLIFKPFLYLPNKNICYATNRIKAYYYYEDFFPRTLKEFDDFCYKIDHSYELNLEEYYNLSSNIGGGISIKKLSKKK